MIDERYVISLLFLLLLLMTSDYVSIKSIISGY